MAEVIVNGYDANSRLVRLLAPLCGDVKVTIDSTATGLAYTDKKYGTLTTFSAVMQAIARNADPNFIGTNPLSKALVSQWLKFASEADMAAVASHEALDNCLFRQGFIAGPMPTIADFAVLALVHPVLVRLGLSLLTDTSAIS